MRGFLVEAGDENVAQLAKLTFRDVHPPIHPAGHVCIWAKHRSSLDLDLPKRNKALPVGAVRSFISVSLPVEAGPVPVKSASDRKNCC